MTYFILITFENKNLLIKMYLSFFIQLDTVFPQVSVINSLLEPLH